MKFSKIQTGAKPTGNDLFPLSNDGRRTMDMGLRDTLYQQNVWASAGSQLKPTNKIMRNNWNLKTDHRYGDVNEIFRWDMAELKVTSSFKYLLRYFWSKYAELASSNREGEREGEREQGRARESERESKRAQK